MYFMVLKSNGGGGGMQIATQNEVLLTKLLEFYKKNDNLNRMLKIINGDTKISLRIIDWFTTNFAKTYFTLYNITKPNGTQIRFKVYSNYKLNLKAYGKDRFDPFCRSDRILVPYNDGTSVETTIGQLLFFKWAIENKVIDYVMNNYTIIEKDMNCRNSTSKRKEKTDVKTRKKREELSISATKSIKKEEVEIVVKFS